ncbi:MULTISPECIES: IS1634 family transposase [unclassified Nocardiopsis]|uniref:IS1634 family transposase n=1 Tax=Nocardiopsis TaxID=2013 RepID=UPI00387B71EA
MGSFVRRVKTASGATAVQIVHKRGRRVTGIDHIGSAHDAAQLALLLHAAQEKLHQGQGVLDLGLAQTSDEPASKKPTATPVAGVGTPIAESTSSTVLWEALSGVYSRLGFDTVSDDAFKALVLGRIVEPASKVDTIRVLGELGVWAPSRATIGRCLKRAVERDYRTAIAHACYQHLTASGPVAMVLYDVTTLHFETDREDRLRKVGMSKERRVDPQVTVGLLTDTSGFPLAVHLFEGNKAETTTLVPVLTEFRRAHPETDIVVVADAGMLSAANLLALEEAGFSFIVGSRSAKTPYDLAEYLETRGNHFTDGQTIETIRRMGTGKKVRQRRVVYQYSFSRFQHDNRAINAMITRAEAVACGERPLKKDRFVKVTGASKGVDWDLVERARFAAGLKGYVTNIGVEVMTGEQVVAAYHDLYQVERSFRMAKSDLAARPVFHRLRESIEAHLTIVFAALAVARRAQALTGASIASIVKTLRPLRTATISLGGQRIQAPPRIPDEAQQMLDTLARGGH